MIFNKNKKTIKSNQNMNVKANSITNNSGVLLSRGKATLISNEDFINQNGGQIKADELAIASLNGSVINKTYSNTYTQESIVEGRRFFGKKTYKKDGYFSNNEQDFTRLASQLGTIFASGVSGLDMNEASNSSQIAVDNNMLPFLYALAGVIGTQSYLNAPTDKNDVYTGIAGEIDKNMNQPMIKVINKSEEVINLFGNDLNTLYVKRDDISQDISTAYNNMPNWARNLTIKPAITIVEYGATGWLPKPISNSYDIYSGQNFETYPTSIWGGIGYINGKLIEQDKNKNNEK